MREAPTPKVAIGGYGVICAAGRGVSALRNALRTNTSHLRPDERFTGARYQSNIVGAAPLEASDNPAFQLACTALQEALANFNRSRGEQSIAPESLGLVLSTTKANIEALERFADNRPCSPIAQRHLQADLLATDLAQAFGARGPVQNISNACVSGLVALMQGAKLIQRGAADAVLVVGVDHLSAFVVGGFSTLKAIDPEGCRPFDQNRRGLSPGEAGAAIILVRQDLFPSAKITLAGWGSSNDANHMTGPSRDGAGLALAIRAALQTANLAPAQIDYANVHGTGTPYNDAMESAALRTIFGAAIPPISGVKGMLGHTLGAAGVVESIVCALALEENFLPGTPRLENIAIDLPSTLIKSPQFQTPLKHVMKLNTGFGGVNGALLFKHE